MSEIHDTPDDVQEHAHQMSTTTAIGGVMRDRLAEEVHPSGAIRDGFFIDGVGVIPPNPDRQPGERRAMEMGIALLIDRPKYPGYDKGDELG